MKYQILKKIVPLLVISSLSFGSFSFTDFSVKTANAQEGPATIGEAAGQALAKGATCLIQAKLQMKAEALGETITGWLGTTQTFDVGKLVGMDSNKTASKEVPVKAKGVEKTVKDANTKEVANQQATEAVSLSKKCIRDAMLKTILDWIVDETITWVQNGGQPRYVTNWDTFLSDAFNVGVGEVVNGIGMGKLCQPFSFQLKLSLLPVPGFKNRIACTLDDIVANINDFYNDFRNGSWIAYEASWQPQNNYYGALYMTMDEAMTEGARQKEIAEKEAMSGQGYLPVKKCVKKLEDACLEWEIITPAPVVGHLTNRAAAADIDWAMSVQSWTAALTNAVINRVTKEGIGLMKKSTAPKTSTSGDYNPYGSYDPALLAKRQERDRVKNNYQTLIVYFNAILANKKSALSSEQQIVVILNELKNRSCQPLVSDSDITNAQNEVARLTAEVANYQTIVNETQAGITEAVDISADFRDREMALLTQNHDAFIIKYQSLIAEISDSEITKITSQEESATKQNELSSAQTRLNLCILTASPTTP